MQICIHFNVNSSCLELAADDTKIPLSLIKAAYNVTGTQPYFNGAAV